MKKASVTVPEPTPLIVNVTLLRALQMTGLPQPGEPGMFDVSPVAVIMICALVNGVAPKVPDTSPLMV